MSEENVTTKPAPAREWTNFIILAVILAGVLVVMALIRPLIFNRIVPAVMGEGQLTAPLPEAEPVELDSETAPADAYPAEETLVEETAVEETAVVEEAYPAETAAAEETDAPISHTVQTGDTILSISRHYSVTVDAIVAINNISNPNHIEVGTTLQIPK